MPHIPFPSKYGIPRNYWSSPATSKFIQHHDQSTKTQFSAPYAGTELTEGLNKIWHLPAPTKCTLSSSLQWFIYWPNLSCKRFWSLYHLQMSSTWHWNCQNYYATCSSLCSSKSSLCCWKILLRLQESYPHPLCWSRLPLRELILRCLLPCSHV